MKRRTLASCEEVEQRLRPDRLAENAQLALQRKASVRNGLVLKARIYGI